MTDMIRIEMDATSKVDPSRDAVFQPQWEGRSQPVWSGKGSEFEGDANYVCGICGLVLAENCRDDIQSNAVLECPSCGASNRFPEVEPWR
jgi:hypothetical protein